MEGDMGLVEMVGWSQPTTKLPPGRKEIQSSVLSKSLSAKAARGLKITNNYIIFKNTQRDTWWAVLILVRTETIEFQSRVEKKRVETATAFKLDTPFLQLPSFHAGTIKVSFFPHIIFFLKRNIALFFKFITLKSSATVTEWRINSSEDNSCLMIDGIIWKLYVQMYHYFLSANL